MLVHHRVQSITINYNQLERGDVPTAAFSPRSIDPGTLLSRQGMAGPAQISALVVGNAVKKHVKLVTL